METEKNDAFLRVLKKQDFSKIFYNEKRLEKLSQKINELYKGSVDDFEKSLGELKNTNLREEIPKMVERANNLYFTEKQERNLQSTEEKSFLWFSLIKKVVNEKHHGNTEEIRKLLSRIVNSYNLERQEQGKEQAKAMEEIVAERNARNDHYFSLEGHPIPPPEEDDDLE